MKRRKKEVENQRRGGKKVKEKVKTVRMYHPWFRRRAPLVGEVKKGTKEKKKKKK
jgi:hypothetical protein